MPTRPNSVPVDIYIVDGWNKPNPTALPMIIVSPKALWDQAQVISNQPMDTVAITGDLNAHGIFAVAESVFEVRQDLSAALAWLNEDDRFVRVTAPSN